MRMRMLIPIAILLLMPNTHSMAMDDHQSQMPTHEQENAEEKENTPSCLIQNLNERLITAVENSNAELVHQLLSQGADPNVLLHNSFKNHVFNKLSPLGFSGRNNKPLAVSLSLLLGATALITNPHIAIPLFIIEYMGASYHVASWFDYGPGSSSAERKRFLETNPPLIIVANVNLLSFGAGPRSLANHGNQIKIAKILLDHKANIDAQSHDGNNALFYAFKHKNTSLTKLLILAGADIQKAEYLSEIPYEYRDIQTTIHTAYKTRLSLIENTKALLHPHSYLNQQMPTRDIIKLIVAYNFPPENQTLDYNDPDINWLIEYLKNTDDDFSMTR